MISAFENKLLRLLVVFQRFRKHWTLSCHIDDAVGSEALAQIVGGEQEVNT
jgi:hypothetical protein